MEFAYCWNRGLRCQDDFYDPSGIEMETALLSHQNLPTEAILLRSREDNM